MAGRILHLSQVDPEMGVSKSIINSVDDVPKPLPPPTKPIRRESRHATLVETGSPLLGKNGMWAPLKASGATSEKVIRNSFLSKNKISGVKTRFRSKSDEKIAIGCGLGANLGDDLGEAGGLFGNRQERDSLGNNTSQYRQSFFRAIEKLGLSNTIYG